MTQNLSNTAIRLNEILITDELLRRPARPPNLEAENHALHQLTQSFTADPQALLQRLLDIACVLCKADTAGVSLLETTDSGGRIFRWVALAGAYANYVGGMTPRNFSPCGICLDYNAPQLFRYPGRCFHYLEAVDPPVVEALVIPFAIQGERIGTLWIAAHQETRCFDREDVRLLTSLAGFSAAALHMARLHEAERHSRERAEQTLAAHRRVEQRLRDNEERLHLALSGARAGAWSWDLLTQEVTWSPELYGLLGLDRATTSPGLEAFFKLIPADERAEAKARFVTAVTQGNPFELEFRLIRPDDAVVWLSTVGRVQRDPNGRLWRADGIYQDITARKHAEHALRESEQRFKLVADTTPAMLWLTDPSGACTFLSRGWFEFTGQTEATGLGWGWLDALHPDDRGPVRETFQTACRQRQPLTLDYRLRRADGSYRWASDTGRPRFAADGGFLGYVGSVIDITERKQVEHAARDSEQFLRRVLDNLFAFVGVMTLDGTLIEANRAPLEAAGIPAEEVLGKKFWDCYWWNYSPAVQAQVRDACERAARGETVRADVVIRIAGDKRMVIDFQIAPLHDGDEHITHLIPSAVDITARRQTQEALRESEQRLRIALDSAQMGIHIWEPDTGALYWDGRLRELWGLTPDDPVDYATFYNGLHPEHRTAVQAAIDHALALASDGKFYKEYRVISRRNGIERWIAASGQVFFEDGHPVRLIGTAVDITARKQAEEALRESEERLRLALDAAEQDWWALDPISYHLTTGPQGMWMHGFAGVDLSCSLPTAGTHLHPEDRPRFEHCVLEALAGDGLLDMEYRVLPPPGHEHAGEVRWISLTGRFTGNHTRLVGIVRDITAQKEAELALQEADRRKDEFLATLAHELRNPLAPIRNGLQLLRLAGQQETIRDQARLMMERQLQHLVRLVDDLLDVSRISRGKIELRKEWINLAEVVQSAVETSRPLLETAGHQLLMKLPSEPVLLEADPARLAQVFANLLNNAAKFTEQGGQITLTAEQQGSTVTVTVADTGIGIPATMLPHIFDLFTQVDRSLERSQGGLGIGLSLVRGLVAMHGGSVEAHSAGPGQGSEFRVRLPVVTPPPMTDTAADPANHVAPCQRRRILVVDDNRDAATSLGMMLQLMGHEVHTAHDGLEALALAEELHPNLVLLDLGMPRLNGYETAQRLRSRPWCRETVLVALTGWGQEEDRRRTREVGFNHHFVKPLNIADLENLLAD